MGFQMKNCLQDFRCTCSLVGGVAHGRPCPLPTIRLEWRSRRIEAHYSLTDDTTTDLRAERLPPPTRSFPFLLCVQIVIWRNAVWTKANPRLRSFFRVFVILPKYVSFVLEAYFQQSHLKTSSVYKFNGDFRHIFLKKNQSLVENCTTYTNIG